MSSPVISRVPVGTDAEQWSGTVIDIPPASFGHGRRDGDRERGSANTSLMPPSGPARRSRRTEGPYRLASNGRERRAPRHSTEVMPPSTRMFCPVTKSEAGEAR